MTKYISFNFSNEECDHIHVVVKIDKDFSFQQLREFDKMIKDKINEYVKNEEYWDSDEMLIDEVLKQASETYNFDFEIVSIDYQYFG